MTIELGHILDSPITGKQLDYYVDAIKIFGRGHWRIFDSGDGPTFFGRALHRVIPHVCLIIRHHFPRLRIYTHPWLSLLNCRILSHNVSYVCIYFLIANGTAGLGIRLKESRWSMALSSSSAGSSKPAAFLGPVCSGEANFSARV